MVTSLLMKGSELSRRDVTLNAQPHIDFFNRIRLTLILPLVLKILLLPALVFGLGLSLCRQAWAITSTQK
ncbi:hypothetical protein AK812_SmicGene12308 [Symbiodinium microadriaticum]|uniref:Uncharacterized protein n=1 Tax=Symbiodinium microadriaticum TaxID=2951 RepID=A0A1Q9EAY2_SYMMI|nr:hypothetical protein AK812_SmicGene12308 [Symbiodinium microadriaticum]